MKITTFKPRRAGDELTMSRLTAARASGLLGTRAGEHGERSAKTQLKGPLGRRIIAK